MKVLKRIILITLIIISIGLISYAAYTFTATQVKYKKDSSTNITVQAALDELEGKASKPKVGDIVNYKANASNAAGTAFGTAYTYTTSNSGANGANQNTGDATANTFSSADDMVWKILYIDKDAGVIRLMAANGTPQTLTLKGPAGYAYSVNILDAASAVYGHGYGATSARSVRVEDINQVTGYDPVKEGKGIHTQTYTANGYYVDLEYGSGNTGTVTTYNRDNNTSNYKKVTADSYYSYTGTTYLANTTNSYKMIFQNTSGSNRSYWHASRCVNFDSSYCYFNVRYVYNGRVNNSILCHSYGSDERNSSLAVCPVVSLDPTVKLTYAGTSDGIKSWNITNAPETRSVWFDANGGVFDDNGTTNVIRYNGSTKISGTYKEPTKEGCVFGGWNTKADGSGTTYANESAIPSTSTMLYAKWKIKGFSRGQIVKYKGEEFYSLNDVADSDTTMEIFAKTNLNSGATEQANAAYGTTACRFSGSQYWGDTAELNLNLESGYAATDAIGKARSYAKAKGAIEGRLLTIQEVENLAGGTTNWRNSTTVDTKIKDMLNGVGNTQNTGSSYTSNGHFEYYWLGSGSPSGARSVWYVYGKSSRAFGSDLSLGDNGVRPVLTVYKSEVTSDEDNTLTTAPTKKFTQGQLVKYKNGEEFYSLYDVSNKATTMEIFAKTNLNSGATEQANAAYGTTGCAFSFNKYWGSTAGLNLNLERGYAATDAIGKARSYAKAKGAISGRLLTKQEVANITGANLDNWENWRSMSNTKIKEMINGEKNSQGYEYYWLGSGGESNSDYVWYVSGDDSSATRSNYYYGDIGVRPVLNVYKSDVSNAS